MFRNVKGEIVIDPDDYFYNLEGEAILLNSAYCPDCRTILISLSRHDFQSCKCGKFTDGGPYYIRRSAGLESRDVVTRRDSVSH